MSVQNIKQLRTSLAMQAECMPGKPDALSVLRSSYKTFLVT